MIYIPDGAAEEREKYKEIWSIPEYRINSPGLVNVDRFMGVIQPESGSSIIDIGCGASVAGLKFKELGLESWYLDITSAAKPEEVPWNRFLETPLWNQWGGKLFPRGKRWDYGFCCDVLEHIPTEYTMLCVDRILSYCDVCWLQIALLPDEFGQLIGEQLHLTVKPYSWWLARLATLGKILDARDLIGNALYVVKR